MLFKLNRVSTISAEVFLVGWLIYAFIRYDLPSDSVFWSAVVIEVTLGFFTYYAHTQYLYNRTHKRWYFLFLILMVIGIGAPFILYYTVDIFKHAGNTWFFYFLSGNSFYLYRIVIKKPLPPQDIPSQRSLIVLRILHSIFLAMIPVMILIVALLPVFGYIPVYTSGDPSLVLIEIVFIVISLFGLIIGMYLQRIVRWIWRTNQSEVFAGFIIHVFRISLFESVAILGLISGILGSAWYVWLPIFVLSGVAMIFTFPTTKHLTEWNSEKVT